MLPWRYSKSMGTISKSRLALFVCVVDFLLMQIDLQECNVVKRCASSVFSERVACHFPPSIFSCERRRKNSVE
jgi:hypothetical protein